MQKQELDVPGDLPFLSGPAELALLKGMLSSFDWWNSALSPWEIVLHWPQAGQHLMSQDTPPGFQAVAGTMGEIWLHSTARILPGAYIEGPAIVGSGTTVGPNCSLREFVLLGSDVTVGQGAEVKASLVLNGSYLSHFCYLGHSILGRNCSFSAGVITATRRLDQKAIYVQWRGCWKSVEGAKVGALIGDDVVIGVGTTIMPGKTIAPHSRILPQSLVAGEVVTPGKQDHSGSRGNPVATPD